MADVIADVWDDGHGGKDGAIEAIVLDDGTRLENHEARLRNAHGDERTLQFFGLTHDFRWHSWGPHNMTAVLNPSTIESMIEAGDMEVVS